MAAQVSTVRRERRRSSWREEGSRPRRAAFL